MLSLILHASYFSASFFQRESKKPSIGKEYFNHMNLEAIVTKYPYRKNLSEEEFRKGYHFFQEAT